MCIYGIFKDDLGFYRFQRREITRSKKDTSNTKHATTQESTTYSSIHGMAQFYKCFIKNFVAIMAPIIKLTRKIEIFL
jgi:hypothetical protein